MKSRYASRVLLTILAIAMIASFECQAATFDIGPGFDNIPDSMTMDNVNTSMLNASTWTSSPGADKVLMTRDQINALNEDCLNNADCNMIRLSAIEPTYDGVYLRGLLTAFTDPKNLYLNGQPVPASYYASIRSNIAGANVQSSMNISYAICTNRCVMSQLPCADALADDVTDPEWDNLALTAVLYNEPLVAYFTTADGRFTYCKSLLCDGWVPTDCIAICHSKEEWAAASNPENFIIVTGDKIQTEKSYVASHSEQTIEMGVKLELCYDDEGTVDNRMNWYNFVVYAPGKGADGLYEKQKMLIPAGSDVHIGYLPMTQENIINQAFKSLGTRYGWGGSENAQDCSAFVREVYMCFGLNLPRNTTWQGAINTEKIDLSSMTVEQKKKALSSIPAGSIIQFPGHEMMYLGEKNGKYYTINDVSSLAKDTEDGLKKIRARDVVINSL